MDEKLLGGGRLFGRLSATSASLSVRWPLPVFARRPYRNEQYCQSPNGNRLLADVERLRKTFLISTVAFY